MSKGRKGERTVSKAKKGERTPSKSKKKATFRWWGDWTVVWIFGGFGLAYLVFIPLEAHPFHWLFSFLGGVVGYGIGLFFDTGLPSKVARFARHNSRRMTLKPDREKQAKRRG